MALFGRGRRRDGVAEWLAVQVAVMFPPAAELERRERQDRERREREVRERRAEVERRIAAVRRGLELDARAAARAEEVRTAGAPAVRTSRHAQIAAQRSVQLRRRTNPVPTVPVPVAAQRQVARDQAARIVAARNVVPG